MSKTIRNRVDKAIASSAVPKMPQRSVSFKKPSRGGMAGVSEAHAGQKFNEGEASHEEKQATRGTMARVAHGAARKVKQVAAQVGAGMRQPAMAYAKSLECPHCGEGISKAYAVKALMIIAKSEGADLDEELEQFLVEEEAPEGDDAEKGVGAPRAPKKGGEKAVASNLVASHRGKAPGAMHSSSRAASGEAVERHHRPTNPVNEKGMHKGFSFPIEENFRLVDYTYGEDAAIAKSIERSDLHPEPARNFRAEQESATGELTE